MLSASTVGNIAKYAAGAATTGCLLVAGGLWYFQRTLIYPAYVPQGSRTEVPKPTAVGLAYEDVTLTTSDNVRLKAYVIPARKRNVKLEELQGMSARQRAQVGEKALEDWMAEMGREDTMEYAKSRPTVVIFHANAGNMGHRIPLARKFNADFGCNVFMLSYRGYGLSEGHPSELGIRIDVETALEYVTKHPLLGGTKLVLFGQSIGGAVCLYAGSMHPDLVSGIIIENTFLSLSTLIPSVLPQIPKFLLPILLTEHWDATLSLPKIPKSTPMLFLSGSKDELVPPSQMVELKRVREESGGKVRWRELEGGHNDTFMARGYWEEVERWLREEIEAGGGVDGGREKTM